MNIFENPLRIKITGKCNKNCSFCHREGDMSNIEDISYDINDLGNGQLIQIINFTHDHLGVDSIAITGGEPLLYDGLEMLLEYISTYSKVKKFSLTTNGTIDKGSSFWYRMRENGLYKVNVSMPDIFSFHNIHFDLIEQEYKVQSELIQVLNHLGVKTNVNVVIYDESLVDDRNLSKLLAFTEDLNTELVFLPDLTNSESFLKSQLVLSKIKASMRLKMRGVERRAGSSNSIEIYQTEYAGKPCNIYIKTTKLDSGNPFYLDCICAQCRIKKRCQEGYYGMRIEQIRGNLYFRLCIYRNDSDVLMTFSEFKNSSAYTELAKDWGNN